jgi:amidohydrolase
MTKSNKRRTMDKIKEEIAVLKEEVVGLRRDIHMHPEIAFEEKRTSSLVASYLRDLEIEVETGIAGTGVVGILRGKDSSKTLLLRADMDALPIKELNEVPYKSQNDGVMHACGHDGHTAMLLVAAKVLSRHKDDLMENVKFVFQPAEEKPPGGALQMIQDGVLETPHVDRAFGVHIINLLPIGKIAIKKGILQAEADSFEVNITGKGGHGAYPQLAKDPVLIASEIVVALQSIVSREIDPLDPAVLTVGKIASGDVANVIPETAYLEGTVRTLRKDVAVSIAGKMERIVTNVARAFQGEAKLDYYYGYPPLMNDSEYTDFVREQAEITVGRANIIDPPISMGGEDMAYFLEKVKGSFVWLGSFNKEKGFDKPNHSAYFDFDEDVLPIGVEMHTRVALSGFE